MEGYYSNQIITLIIITDTFAGSSFLIVYGVWKDGFCKYLDGYLDPKLKWIHIFFEVDLSWKVFFSVRRLA